MGTQTETNRAGEFILSEANGSLSREQKTLITGQVLGAGAVIGIITASGKVTEYDNAAVDGSESAAGIIFQDADATGADVPCTIISRLAEVSDDLLVWEAGQDAGDQTAGKADLATLDIIAR